MNYLICFLLCFVIVRGSLAMLAVRGERFWASARQRPRRPDSSELPSPFLPDSVVSTYGRILVRATGFEVGAPCSSSGELDFSPAKKPSEFGMALAMGISGVRFKASP
jgi:hypothetical protein